MPENRFGGVNQQPLYNATGRINRGEAPQAPQFQAPSAGVSKNFGAADMPNNAAGTQGGFGANLMQSAYYGSSPINLYGGNSGGGGRRGRRGRQSGGGGNDGNIDNSITIGDFTGFGADSGMKVNNQGMGGQNFNAFNDNGGGAVAAPQEQQGEKPKRVVTPEQKAARKTRDQQNKSGARTPVARGPRQKPAVASAATYSGNTSAPTIQANNTDARSSSQTINAGASTPPATQQGPGQPGAPAMSFGSVTGASLGKPAKIGPTKVGKK